MLGDFRRRRHFRYALLPALRRNQTVQIVAIRSIRTKRFLVKQALDSASRAYLVTVPGGPNRPTHFAMPAASEQNYADARKCGCQKT